MPKIVFRVAKAVGLGVFLLALVAGTALVISNRSFDLRELAFDYLQGEKELWKQGPEMSGAGGTDNSYSTGERGRISDEITSSRIGQSSSGPPPPSAYETCLASGNTPAECSGTQTGTSTSNTQTGTDGTTNTGATSTSTTTTSFNCGNRDTRSCFCTQSTCYINGKDGTTWTIPASEIDEFIAVTDELEEQGLLYDEYGQLGVYITNEDGTQTLVPLNETNYDIITGKIPPYEVVNPNGEDIGATCMIGGDCKSGNCQASGNYGDYVCMLPGQRYTVSTNVQLGGTCGSSIYGKGTCGSGLSCGVDGTCGMLNAAPCTPGGSKCASGNCQGTPYGDYFCMPPGTKYTVTTNVSLGGTCGNNVYGKATCGGGLECGGGGTCGIATNYPCTPGGGACASGNCQENHYTGDYLCAPQGVRFTTTSCSFGQTCLPDNSIWTQTKCASGLSADADGVCKISTNSYTQCKDGSDCASGNCQAGPGGSKFCMAPSYIDPGCTVVSGDLSSCIITPTYNNLFSTASGLGESCGSGSFGNFGCGGGLGCSGGTCVPLQKTAMLPNLTPEAQLVTKTVDGKPVLYCQGTAEACAEIQQDIYYASMGRPLLTLEQDENGNYYYVSGPGLSGGGIAEFQCAAGDNRDACMGVLYQQAETQVAQATLALEVAVVIATLPITGPVAVQAITNTVATLQAMTLIDWGLLAVSSALAAGTAFTGPFSVFHQMGINAALNPNDTRFNPQLASISAFGYTLFDFGNITVGQFYVDYTMAKAFSWGLSQGLQAATNTGFQGALLTRGVDVADNLQDAGQLALCALSGDTQDCYESMINLAIGPADIIEGFDTPSNFLASYKSGTLDEFILPNEVIINNNIIRNLANPQYVSATTNASVPTNTSFTNNTIPQNPALAYQNTIVGSNQTGSGYTPTQVTTPTTGLASQGSQPVTTTPVVQPDTSIPVSKPDTTVTGGQSNVTSSTPDAPTIIHDVGGYKERFTYNEASNTWTWERTNPTDPTSNEWQQYGNLSNQQLKEQLSVSLANGDTSAFEISNFEKLNESTLDQIKEVAYVISPDLGTVAKTTVSTTNVTQQQNPASSIEQQLGNIAQGIKTTVQDIAARITTTQSQPQTVPQPDTIQQTSQTQNAKLTESLNNFGNAVQSGINNVLASTRNIKIDQLAVGRVFTSLVNTIIVKPLVGAGRLASSITNSLVKRAQQFQLGVNQYFASRPQTAQKPVTPQVQTVSPKSESSGKSIASSKHPSENQDAIYHSGELETGYTIAAVFDGIGGHQGGHEASQIARDVTSAKLTQLLGDPNSPVNENDIPSMINQALQAANDEIYKTQFNNLKLRGMGTTATVVVIKDGTAYVGHVGDSRLYIFRSGSGQFEQISQDHSSSVPFLFGEGYSMSEIKNIQSKIDDLTQEPDSKSILNTVWNIRNRIYKSLGNKTLSVDTTTINLESGDVVILTSDGVHDNLTTTEMHAKIIQNLDKSANQIASVLTDSAYQRSLENHFRSKPDDISTVVVKVPMQTKSNLVSTIRNSFNQRRQSLISLVDNAKQLWYDYIDTVKKVLVYTGLVGTFIVFGFVVNFFTNPTLPTRGSLPPPGITQQVSLDYQILASVGLDEQTQWYYRPISSRATGQFESNLSQIEEAYRIPIFVSSFISDEALNSQLSVSQDIANGLSLIPPHILNMKFTNKNFPFRLLINEFTDSPHGFTHGTGDIYTHLLNFGSVRVYAHNPDIIQGFTEETIIHEALHSFEFNTPGLINQFIEVAKNDGIHPTNTEGFYVDPNFVANDFMGYNSGKFSGKFWDRQAFAYNGSAYVLAPDEVKNKQPNLYQFFKDKVFNGVEYHEIINTDGSHTIVPNVDFGYPTVNLNVQQTPTSTEPTETETSQETEKTTKALSPEEIIVQNPYLEVVLPQEIYQTNLANADYQQYNDQNYLPYFAQAAEIINPGDTQFSFLAQAIYQSERGSVSDQTQSGLGGINSGWVTKNGRLYPSESGIIHRALFDLLEDSPETEDMLHAATSWIGLEVGSDERNQIFQAYHHPNATIAAKTQAFVSTLILHQFQQEYGKWLAPLQYVSGRANNFIDQLTPVTGSREEAIVLANEIIVDIYRFRWGLPTINNYQFTDIRIITEEAVNEYGQKYNANFIDINVTINGIPLTIRLNAVQYLMNIEGDPRMGFFDRYNKLVYDAGQGWTSDQTVVTPQTSNIQDIMIMGDSIAQALAGGPAQSIIQPVLTGQDINFVGNQSSFAGGVPNQAYSSITSLEYAQKLFSGEISFTTDNTPGLVIIQLGTNDLASGHVANQADIDNVFIPAYESIILKLRQENPTVTILVLPVPETTQPWNALVDDVNATLVSMANRLNNDPNVPNSPVRIVNQGRPLFTVNQVADDGVHPSLGGIQSMVESILREITNVLPDIVVTGTQPSGTANTNLLIPMSTRPTTLEYVATGQEGNLHPFTSSEDYIDLQSMCSACFLSGTAQDTPSRIVVPKNIAIHFTASGGNSPSQWGDVNKTIRTFVNGRLGINSSSNFVVGYDENGNFVLKQLAPTYQNGVMQTKAITAAKNVFINIEMSGRYDLYLNPDGSVNEEMFSSPIVQETAQLVSELAQYYHIPVDEIIGHGELQSYKSKDAPQAFMDRFRGLVQQKINEQASISILANLFKGPLPVGATMFSLIPLGQNIIDMANILGVEVPIKLQIPGNPVSPIIDFVNSRQHQQVLNDIKNELDNASDEQKLDPEFYQDLSDRIQQSLLENNIAFDSQEYQETKNLLNQIENTALEAGLDKNQVAQIIMGPASGMLAAPYEPPTEVNQQLTKFMSGLENGDINYLTNDEIALASSNENFITVYRGLGYNYLSEGPQIAAGFRNGPYTVSDFIQDPSGTNLALYNQQKSSLSPQTLKIIDGLQKNYGFGDDVASIIAHVDNPNSVFLATSKDRVTAAVFAQMESSIGKGFVMEIKIPNNVGVDVVKTFENLGMFTTENYLRALFHQEIAIPGGVPENWIVDIKPVSELPKNELDRSQDLIHRYLDQTQSNGLIGSGPAQWFESWSQKYIYSKYPQAAIDGATPTMIWEGVTTWVKDVGRTMGVGIKYMFSATSKPFLANPRSTQFEDLTMDQMSNINLENYAPDLKPEPIDINSEKALLIINYLNSQHQLEDILFGVRDLATLEEYGIKFDPVTGSPIVPLDGINIVKYVLGGGWSAKIARFDMQFNKVLTEVDKIIAEKHVNSGVLTIRDLGDAVAEYNQKYYALNDPWENNVEIPLLIQKVSEVVLNSPLIPIGNYFGQKKGCVGNACYPNSVLLSAILAQYGIESDVVGFEFTKPSGKSSIHAIVQFKKPDGSFGIIDPTISYTDPDTQIVHATYIANQVDYFAILKAQGYKDFKLWEYETIFKPLNTQVDKIQNDPHQLQETTIIDFVNSKQHLQVLNDVEKELNNATDEDKSKPEFYQDLSDRIQQSLLENNIAFDSQEYQKTKNLLNQIENTALEAGLDKNQVDQIIMGPASGMLPAPYTPEDQYFSIENNLDQINQLARNLTGFEITDPKIIDKLITDHLAIKTKYNLPPRDLRFSDPNEYINQLTKTASDNKVPIINNSENPEVIEKYYQEHPDQNSLYDTAFDDEGNRIFYTSTGDAVIDAGQIEHELIHALQFKNALPMTIEQQEYEAYVGANMVNNRDALSQAVINTIFQEILFLSTYASSIKQEIPTTEYNTSVPQAIEGIQDYAQVLGKLSRLSRLLIQKNNNNVVLPVFTGVTPEAQVLPSSIFFNETFYDAFINNLSEAIKTNENYLLIRHENRHFSLLNLSAVKNVIQNNQDLFPNEALINTKDWLEQNPSEWHTTLDKPNDTLVNARYGLLSGFSRPASLAHGAFWSGLNKLRKNESVFKSYYETLGTSYEDPFFGQNSPPDQQLKETRMDIISKINTLSEQEMVALVNAYGISIPSIPLSFIAFYESDLNWATGLKNIHQEAVKLARDETGIDVITELSLTTQLATTFERIFISVQNIGTTIEVGFKTIFTILTKPFAISKNQTEQINLLGRINTEEINASEEQRSRPEFYISLINKAQRGLLENKIDPTSAAHQRTMHLTNEWMGKVNTVNFALKFKAADIAMLEQEYGEMIEGGAFGMAFINKDKKEFTKIYYDPNLPENIYQKEFYEIWNGETPLVTYIRGFDYLDNNGARIFGFTSRYFDNSVELDEFIESGQKLTQEEIVEAITTLTHFHNATSHAHGDLYRSDWSYSPNTEGLHPGNILIQQLPDGGHKVIFVDLVGYNMWQNPKEGFIDAELTDVKVILKEQEELDKRLNKLFNPSNSELLVRRIKSFLSLRKFQIGRLISNLRK